MANRTSRLNSRELKAIKDFLISRDGANCKICGKEPSKVKLIIDHIDNDFRNNIPENLQLTCQSCNIKKNPPYKLKGDVDNFSLSQSLSLSDIETTCQNLTSVPLVTLENYPIWKNIKSEPKFQSWLQREMTKKLTMDVKQVINDGANIAQCSSKTTASYLDKLVYETGPYCITKDTETGIRMLVWKEKDFPFKEEIKKWAK